MLVICSMNEIGSQPIGNVLKLESGKSREERIKQINNFIGKY